MAAFRSGIGSQYREFEKVSLFPYCFSEIDVQPSDLTNAFGLKETGLIQMNTVLQKKSCMLKTTLKQKFLEVQLFY